MQPELDEGQLKALSVLKNGNILCGGVGSGKSRTGLAYWYTKVCGGQIDGKKRGLDKDLTPMLWPKDLYIITTAKKRDKNEWDDELEPFWLSTASESPKIVVDS